MFFLNKQVNLDKIFMLGRRRELLDSLIYLGKHGLPVQGCHDTLITVHSYTCVVKGFFGMSQFIPQVRYATFEYTSEVPWDKRATNT